MKHLANEACVTTGAIYHHFQSKNHLYSIIREEMERRIVDRMEGAAAVFAEPIASLRAAILVGFDAAVKLEATRLLCEEDPTDGPDRIESYLESLASGILPGLSVVLAASLRASLHAVAVNRLTVEEARRGLEWTLNKK